MAPAPIGWPPSQWWDGDDGSWSSFALRVGSSEQTVRVLPSTAGQEMWVVSPQGCPPGRNGTSTSSPCSQSRGGLFDSTQSSSWQTLGNYSLGLELNLGYDDTALYGLDTVALGFDNSIGGPTIGSQVISALATDDYYLGVFGLGHQGTNISNFTEPRPSFLTAMRNEGLIPSLSWAYTAGAPYRSKGVFGSLTFGGYDRSRFVPSNVSLSLATDISRDLVVGLQSISSTTTNDSTTLVTQQQSLLPNPILTFIDSTIPYIYLPIEACQEFEKTLGLDWNSTAEMYWVSETLHQSLLSKNLSFTFTIGDATSGGPTVQIELPYASFDLEVNYPFAQDTTRYFPLQQAVNESQYTLGRTFLQEAYIIVDYERSNFSVSQCRFEDGVPTDLVAIPSATETPNHLHRNVAIGTSIGTALFLLLATLAAVFTIRRWRQKRMTQLSSEATEPPTSSQEPRALSFKYAREIDYNSMVEPFRELPDSAKARVELLNEQAPSGSGNEISEMSEVLPPVSHELRADRGSHIMVQTRTADRWKIFTSTKILRKSWTSLASSDRTTCVETAISASPLQRKGISMGRSSIDTSNLEAEIYSLYARKSLDLYRSLPPTPISESPQISPILANFNVPSFFCQRPQMAKVSARGSMSAFDSPARPVSIYPAIFSKSKRLPPSVLLKSLKTIDSPSRAIESQLVEMSYHSEERTWPQLSI